MKILEERAKTHGSFLENSSVSQRLKDVLRYDMAHTKLRCTQREALDMICHKIGRILAGNPDFIDHWQDIAGYAQLIVNELEGQDDEN